MSMSGIEVDPDVDLAFNDMKDRFSDKFITFKIEKKKKIVVDHRSGPKSTSTREEDEESFQELVALLKDESRYIVYRFGFTSSVDGRKFIPLAFIFWSPTWAKISDKMIYASSKDTIKKHLTGLRAEFFVDEEGDLDYSTFADEMQRKS